MYANDMNMLGALFIFNSVTACLSHNTNFFLFEDLSSFHQKKKQH